MGLCLIGSVWYLDVDTWIAIVKVAIGLGFVIFVHELGHFAVAKACGVKCEKFYLGFDIAGLKLCKFRWGETEYGIGILPLGGYVKMLGQEDNPARLKEEIERAKQETTGEETGRSQGKHARQSDTEKVDLDAAKQALFDPRSYLAKSVPKRMAIISAGVVMNLIFAFLMAVVAFRMGVRRVEAVVGQVMPGAAAWQEGIRVGDQIVEVAGQKIAKFRDLREAVSLGDHTRQGAEILVRRPGVKDLLRFMVLPDDSGLLPMIGILSSSTTRLLKPKHSADVPAVAIPGSAAARATPPLRPGDNIVKVDDTPLQSYEQLHAYLATHRDQPLRLVVRRGDASGNQAGSAAGDDQEVSVLLPASPMRRLGVVMEMGQITAVQEDSPAAEAGLRPGDKITKVDGQPVGDPLTLPDRLRRRAPETVKLTVERGSPPHPLDLEVTLRTTDWYETPIQEDDPTTAPALGIAYKVLNRVRGVVPHSPAAEAGLRAGDQVVTARLVPPEDQTPYAEEFQQKDLDIEFGEKQWNWPSMIYHLQTRLPGTQVELTWQRGGRLKTAMLRPRQSPDWFNPDRGLLLEPLTFVETAGSFGEALKLGAKETIHATLLVYRFLQKLGTRISPRALGGPVSIFMVAKQHAEQGTADLLIFLTVLSANLAVLNFLPIPLLDGGHMVLLAWEGIRGKPADERVQVALTYLGLMFILTLMIWVIGLDVVRLFSGF